jgi:hypothetical protein
MQYRLETVPILKDTLYFLLQYHLIYRSVTATVYEYSVLLQVTVHMYSGASSCILVTV